MFMLLNDILLYENPRLIEINRPGDDLYYKFDYDTRSFNVNMEFQHFHEFYEIFILLDEAADHIIEGKIYNTQRFDIVALKPRSLHKTHYPKGEPKKRLIVRFYFNEKAPGLETYLSQILSIFNAPVPIYRFDENKRQVLFALINDIFSFSESKDSVRNLMIHNKFVELLYHIYISRNKNVYEVESVANPIVNKVYSITSFIHDHYSEELSLDYIADKFFISTYYLSHQFKKITGFNLINYIQMTRVKNAQQLLLYTDLKITVIAEQCGFTSFSQFNRVFNKFCKCSPSQFRTENNITN